MERSRLLILLPAAATTLVVAMMLGPARERPVVGARLLVGGRDPAGIRSMRLETIERGAPIPRHVDAGDVSLFVGDAKRPIWTGRTGPHGVVEITLETPLPQDTVVTVRGRGDVLAEGQLIVGGDAAPTITDASLEGVASGELRVTASVAAGTFVPSLPGTLVVGVADEAGPLEEAKLTLKSSSIEPAELETGVTAGKALVDLVVIAPPAVVELTATAGARTGSLRVELPATMGAIAANPTDDQVELVSPAPRDVAFVSTFDETGRVGGGVVPLQTAPDGFFRGSCPIGPGVRALTVSSDPHETSAATVTWPGPARSGSASAPKLTVALDGLPRAAKDEATRLSHVRTLTTAALSLAAALEIAILLGTRREAARAAAARSDENAGAGPDASRLTTRSSWAFLAAMSGLVLLALAAMLGLIVLR